MHHETTVVKHFGYGKHILLQAFVNTATVRDQHKQSYAVRGIRQSDSLIIITLYLLLSGDVHPCPGPTYQGASSEDMKKKHHKMNFFKTVTHSRMIWDSQHKPSGIFGGHINIRSLTPKAEQMHHLLRNSNLGFFRPV